MTKSFVDIRLTRNTGFTLRAKFDLPNSGVTVLFGPSGCGKTTILRAVAGLEKVEGAVYVNGKIWQDDVKKIFIPTYKRKLGYIFQEPSLFAHLTVNENLRFGFQKESEEKSEAMLQEALSLLGIENLLDRRENELSGGEKQRVAIARTITMSPDILLMDEPLSALDWARKKEILPWLIRLKKELNIPILYVTHSLTEMRELADEVILLEDGNVKFVGLPGEVLKNIESQFELEEALYLPN